MQLSKLLPPETRPWSSGEIPPTTRVAEVPDGLYSYTNESLGFQTFARCASGSVVCTLRLWTNGEVKGRYDDYSSGQEYQIISGVSYLEDFGGRVEGPGYPTSQIFGTWIAEKIVMISRTCVAEPGYRPNRKVFLNLMPHDFAGSKAQMTATGTASSTGFYPTALGYIPPRPSSEEILLLEAAQLYLSDPIVETLEKRTLVTGFHRKIEYERWLLRGLDEQMDLFISVFYERFWGLVVVGLCSFQDRPKAEEGILGCQKLFLQALVKLV